MEQIYPQISSITKGPRQSNMELLRIVAMFLVLIDHATFYTTGTISYSDYQENPLFSFTETFFAAASQVCVDVFVLISGWFGIRPSVKGLANFIFQCVFFLLIIYVFSEISGFHHFSIRKLAAYFLCKPNGYWFVVSYLGLYVISPILNRFIQMASKREYAFVLSGFFIFQTIWGFSGIASFVYQGYSTFSFMGLYLLARYVRTYEFDKLKNWGAVIYMVSVLLNAGIYYFSKIFNFPSNSFSYVNPLVIVGAIGLTLCFAKLQINSSKLINWVAGSSFAVYLFHCNSIILNKLFKAELTDVYSECSGLACLFSIFGVLLLFFLLAIILDQPRIWLWRIMLKRFAK